MNCCLAHSLRNAAARCPDKIAVVHVGDSPSCRALVSYTFAEVWSSVESLATTLEAAMLPSDGSVPRLGVWITQSAEYLVALAAVTKVGAAFVPLDPSWPVGRAVAVVNDAGCSLLIGCYQAGWSPPNYQRTFEELCQTTGCVQIRMSECGRPKGLDTSNASWSCRELPFSYIMYTSGSTGKPKGVCGTQKGLLNRLRWMEDAYPYFASEVACFKTSISFIDHLTESFGPLLAGIPVVVLQGVKDNPLHLVNVLETYKMSRLTAVPSLLRAILPALQTSTSVKTLRVLISSGELLSVHLLLGLREVMPNATILNLYGSTELSGDCMYYDCEHFPRETLHLKSVPVGKEIPGCTVLLIDEETASVDTGELCVGGLGLAFGYWNNLLSTRFLDIKGYGRVFKTGDLARRLESGDLVLLGRKDRLLKIHGQRIEPQEIEVRLEEHVQVERAAVCSIQFSGDDVQLVAYAKMKDVEATCSESSLKEWLMSELPGYMVPERIIILPTIPVTGSGKVDYISLQDMYVFRRHESSIVPETMSKFLRSVIQAFSKVLSVEKVSPFDDFFLLGGTSISAAHVAHKLGIDMRLLLKHRSAVKLTDAINLIPDQEAESTRKRTVSREEPSKCSCQMRKKQKTLADNSDIGTVSLSSWPHGLQFGTSAFVRGVHVSSPTLSQPVSSSLSIKRAWKHCLHACIDASPLVVTTTSSLRLYIGSHANMFVCLDAVSGELEWEAILGDRVESTAAITRDFSQVVVGCYDGDIYFLDAADGSLCWKFHTDGEVKCQPFVDSWRGFVWCGSHDHTLYVLDPVSHVCVWKHKCDGSVFASPVADNVNQRVYVASTNGTLLLIDTMPSYRVAWEHSAGAPMFGAPAVVSSKSCVVFGTVDGFVTALSWAGSVLWKVKTGGPVFSAACASLVLKEQVLVPSRDGNVYSYYPATGELLWKYDIGEPVVASVGVDEISWLADETPISRFVCVCGTSGSVYVIKIRSDEIGSSQKACEIAATLKLPGELFSSPLMLGRRIFVGCRDDNVYCLDLV